MTITPEATQQIAALPTSIRNRLLRMVQRLQRWPAVSGAKPLRGALAGHYRMRTGDYRMQFHVRGESLIVEKVGHRDGFYED